MYYYKMIECYGLQMFSRYTIRVVYNSEIEVQKQADISTYYHSPYGW